MAFNGVNVERLADQDGVALFAGRGYDGSPTVARTYTLPLLATLNVGGEIAVINTGAADITIVAGGTDQVNDTGAPGTVTLIVGATVTLIAKVLEGATAATWFAIRG